MEKTIINVRLHDRFNKLGFALVFDEKGHAIGKAIINKEYICPLTKRTKLSIMVYMFNEFNSYRSGQVYQDDLKGWIKNQGTKFN